MSSDSLSPLLSFAKETLFDEASTGPITATTPLISSGLLKSLETARLIAFVKDQLGVRIPPTAMVRTNFENLQTLSDLVDTLRDAAA